MVKTPAVFIGSSKEGKKYCQAFENELFRDEIEVIPWYRIFDDPLLVNIEQLEKLKNFDFAILILTPDDIVQYHGEENYSARDNLIFELGLLIGYLGRNRVFPVIPENPKIKLPTDLLGTNPYPFHFSEKYKELIEYQQAVSYASNHIRDKINIIGSKAPAVGEKASGYQSGIRFADHIIYKKETNSLKFRIGYESEGNLRNVKINVLFHHIIIDKDKGLLDVKYNPMEIICVLPEMDVVYQFHHPLEDSPLIDFFDEKIEDELVNFHQLPGKIIVYVTGLDTITMVKQYNNKTYWPKMICEGSFGTFHGIDQNGNAIRETIRWDEFNKII